jgi:hypothetical protein
MRVAGRDIGKLGDGSHAALFQQHKPGSVLVLRGCRRLEVARRGLGLRAMV